MIDTIRFTTPISPRDSVDIRNECYRTEKSKKEGNNIVYQVYNGNFEIGSYSRNLNIFFPKNNEKMIFEFSIPKYVFGHNVAMLYRKELPQVIIQLYEELNSKFNYFPSFKLWDLERIDFCYNWKFETEEEMKIVMNILRLLDYPRKKKYLYDTSLMFRGKTFSIKFYEKYDEFLKHDYKAMIEKAEKGVFTDSQALEMASYIKELSKNVLRYEVTLRKQALMKIYNKESGEKIRLNDIMRGKAPKEILQRYLDKLFKYINLDSLNEHSALDKLLRKYSKTKAYRLYNFYTDYYSQDDLKKEILKNSFSRTQFYRNKRALEEAGLGVPIKETEIKNLDFKFEIKDPYE